MASTLGMTVDEVRTALSGVGDAANNATRQVGTFSQELTRGSKQIASSVSSFAGSLGRGQTSISSFSRVFSTLGDSLGGLVETIPQLGKFGKYAGKGIGLLGDAAAYATDQLSDSMSAWQELSTVGITTSESVIGLTKQIQEAGMPLKMFSTLTKQSSKQLAALQGTTGDAGSEFATTMGTMRKDLNMELRKIGFTTEEISETVINFADLQRRLGRGQRLTSVQLQEQTQEYAKELDKVSKLTGMQREEQQKLVDAAMREGRWRSTMEDLGAKQQTQMNMLNNSMSAFSSEMSEGLRDQASGFTQSEAAQKLFRTTNGASVEIMEKVKSGQLSAQEAMLAFQEAVKANKGPMKALNQAVGDQAGVYVRYNQSMDLLTADFNSLDEAVKTQKKQLEDRGVTDNLANVERALQNAAGQVQSMVVQLPIVSDGLKLLATSASHVVDSFYALIHGKDRVYTRQETRSEAELIALKQEREILREQLKDAKTIHKQDPFWKGGEKSSTFTQTENEVKRIEGLLTPINTAIAKLEPIVQKEIQALTKSVRDVLFPKVLEAANNNQEVAERMYAELVKQIKAQDLGPNRARTGIKWSSPIDGVWKEGSPEELNVFNKRVDEMIKVLSQNDLYNEEIKQQTYFGFDIGDPKHIKTLNAPVVDKLNEIFTRPIEVIPREQTTKAPIDTPEMAKGGVLSGPKSGYNVTMHGTEAVVPLPDKKGIPVNVQAESQTTKHIELLEKQVSKLTDVVSAIEDNTNVNNKILRVTQN